MPRVSPDPVRQGISDKPAKLRPRISWGEARPDTRPRFARILHGPQSHGRGSCRPPAHPPSPTRHPLDPLGRGDRSGAAPHAHHAHSRHVRISARYLSRRSAGPERSTTMRPASPALGIFRPLSRHAKTRYRLCAASQWRSVPERATPVAPAGGFKGLARDRSLASASRGGLPLARRGTAHATPAALLAGSCQQVMTLRARWHRDLRTTAGQLPP